MKLLVLLLVPATLLSWLAQEPFQVRETHIPRTLDVAQPGTLPLEEIRAALGNPDLFEPYVPKAPLGLPDLDAFIPAENPLTPAKVFLGAQLYFDKRLSRDGTVSCATCHDPAKGWADGAPVSTGIAGQEGGRSAPSIVNRVFGRTQFWDGRAASLEEQALGPIGNPIEMGFSVEEAAARLNEIPGYVLEFEAVFGGEATPDRIARAIAAFERTIIVGNSKNDYYERALPLRNWSPEDEDDEDFIPLARKILAEENLHRMSPSALRGRELFFDKAACSTCHLGADFTDEQFHNVGVGVEGDSPDTGLMAVTGRKEDWGKFKTPGLRNIKFTAPYMHDGSQATLLEVVKHYNQGGIKNPTLSENIFPLNLTDQEMLDLVQFMEEALTSTVPPFEVPRLP